MPKHTKKERKKNNDNALSRALRDLFGFGVGGGGKAIERAGNVFTRAAKKIEKDTETLKKRKR